MIRAILTDIEGTTTSVSFVFEVLLPYARRRLAAFVADHGGEPAVREQLDAVAREVGRRWAAAHETKYSSCVNWPNRISAGVSMGQTPSVPWPCKLIRP